MMVDVCRMEHREWSVEDGGCRVESNGSRVDCGCWRVGDVGCRGCSVEGEG